MLIIYKNIIVNALYYKYLIKFSIFYFKIYIILKKINLFFKLISNNKIKIKIYLIKKKIIIKCSTFRSRE
jgi:hypothetical protein